MHEIKSLLMCGLVAAGIALPSLAAAGEPGILHADWAVTIGEPSALEALLPDCDAVTPLTSWEMADERGGVSGLSFEILFEGTVNGNSGEGVMKFIGPNGVQNSRDESPSPSDNHPDAEIQNFLGSVGPFQGIGQWAIVNGDGNDVTNNLTVNIFVTDETGATTSFADVLSLIDVTGL